VNPKTNLIALLLVASVFISLGIINSHIAGYYYLKKSTSETYEDAQTYIENFNLNVYVKRNLSMQITTHIRLVKKSATVFNFSPLIFPYLPYLPYFPIYTLTENIRPIEIKKMSILMSRDLLVIFNKTVNYFEKVNFYLNSTGIYDFLITYEVEHCYVNTFVETTIIIAFQNLLIPISKLSITILMEKVPEYVNYKSLLEFTSQKLWHYLPLRMNSSHIWFNLHLYDISFPDNSFEIEICLKKLYQLIFLEADFRFFSQLITVLIITLIFVLVLNIIARVIFGLELHELLFPTNKLLTLLMLLAYLIFWIPHDYYRVIFLNFNVIYLISSYISPIILFLIALVVSFWINILVIFPLISFLDILKLRNRIIFDLQKYYYLIRRRKEYCLQTLLLYYILISYISILVYNVGLYSINLISYNLSKPPLIYILSALFILALIIYLYSTYFYAEFNYGLIDILKSLQCISSEESIRWEDILERSIKRWRNLDKEYLKELIDAFLDYYEERKIIYRTSVNTLRLIEPHKIHKTEISLKPDKSAYEEGNRLRRKMLVLIDKNENFKLNF